MNITAEIDYWGDGVAVFDPEKVLDRLVEWFPEVIIDPKDYSQEEVESVKKFVAVDPEKRSFMIEQIQAKNRRGGPTFKFGFETTGGQKIEGHARRYSVSFRSKEEIDDQTRQKIVGFLESLKLGQINSA